MEKLKADATKVFLCARRLKALHEHNEANILKRAKELDLKEKDLQKLRLELEERFKEVELREKELQSLSLELDERVEYFEAEKVRAGDQIEILENKLGEVKAELRRCCSEAEKARERIEEETDRRKKGLDSVLDKIIESSKQLVAVDEKLESRQRELKKKELRSLSGLDKRTKMGEADIVKRFQELEVKEKEVQRLSLELEESRKIFTKEKVEAGNLKKMVECTEELRSKRNQLTAKMDSFTRYERALEEKERQLRQVGADLRRRCEETREVEVRKREIEGEISTKKKELASILDELKESGKQRLLTRSLELVAKEEELERVKESIKVSQSELEEKQNMVQSLRNYITICGQKIDSKSKELEDIQKKIEQQTGELGVLNDKLDTKEKRHKEIVETNFRSSSELEERAKEISAATDDLRVRSQRFRMDVEDKEKKLNLLRLQIELEEKRHIQLKREMELETDGIKKDLELILSKIKESSKELESQRRLLEIQSQKLVSKENELKCVGESSKRLNIDLEMKEKRVQELSNLIKISDEQLDLKSKELGEVKKLIEEERRKLCDMQNQQPSPAPVNETAASIVRDEVSRTLRASPNPVELVLDLVQEYIREGSGLEEDSSMEIMVLFFDELAKLRLTNEPQLQVKATEVATLWKGKITIKAPKSSLEALAFLLFIVAYGLKELINQEETALLASSIAHYEQAPTLCNSLGLTLMVPGFVKELIKKREFIPAVRFMCLFKLNSESSFSPSELLKEEIMDLRQSALGKRPSGTGSSQAKDKDAGRLRAILELVADYNLEIDLPGDLVANLIVQREKPTLLVRCSMMQHTSSTHQQANSPNPVSSQGSSVNSGSKT